MLTGPIVPDSEGDRLGTLGWDVGTDVGANVGRGVGVVVKEEAVELEKSQWGNTDGCDSDPELSERVGDVVGLSTGNAAVVGVNDVGDGLALEV